MWIIVFTKGNNQIDDEDDEGEINLINLIN
jgi:hypothetical protein